MAKNSASEATPQTADAAPKLSITDFCTRLSETLSRPELIGAFAAAEQRAGHVIDTSDRFQDRFDAFIHQPV